MLPSLLFTMRTCDRTPKRNYLARTINSLIANGVRPDEIHLCANEPDTSWMDEWPLGLHVQVPTYRLTPNETGLSQIGWLRDVAADWIVMTEDDLEWCADPIGSMARWLDDYAQDDISVYRFFAFDRMTPRGAHVASAPLREQKGSQAVAMRAGDAVRFASWAKVNRNAWRPKSAPFQNRPHDGFDKLIGYWALGEGRSDIGLVATPFFCRHIGDESSLHRYGRRMDQSFAGSTWAYREETCEAR